MNKWMNGIFLVKMLMHIVDDHDRDDAVGAVPFFRYRCSVHLNPLIVRPLNRIHMQIMGLRSPKT